MTSTFEIANLFNVNGLVAVVTGGGSGNFIFLHLMSSLTLDRHWPHDNPGPGSQWCNCLYHRAKKGSLRECSQHRGMLPGLVEVAAGDKGD